MVRRLFSRRFILDASYVLLLWSSISVRTRTDKLLSGARVACILIVHRQQTNSNQSLRFTKQALQDTSFQSTHTHTPNMAGLRVTSRKPTLCTSTTSSAFLKRRCGDPQSLSVTSTHEVVGALHSMYSSTFVFYVAFEHSARPKTHLSRLFYRKIHELLKTDCDSRSLVRSRCPLCTYLISSDPGNFPCFTYVLFW